MRVCSESNGVRIHGMVPCNFLTVTEETIEETVISDLTGVGWVGPGARVRVRIRGRCAHLHYGTADLARDGVGAEASSQTN